MALLLMIMPIMSPYRPKAEAKISIISMDTKVSGFWACVLTVPEPITPTDMPHDKLLTPTTRPAQNRQ